MTLCQSHDMSTAWGCPTLKDPVIGAPVHLFMRRCNLGIGMRGLEAYRGSGGNRSLERTSIGLE